MEIKQTYVRLRATTFSENSRGSSITAALVTDDFRDTFRLIVTWISRTRRLAEQEGYEEFYGTSVIDLSKDGATRYMDDHYFTRRNPQTQGRLRLEWTSAVRLNRYQ